MKIFEALEKLNEETYYDGDVERIYQIYYNLGDGTELREEFDNLEDAQKFYDAIEADMSYLYGVLVELEFDDEDEHMTEIASFDHEDEISSGAHGGQCLYLFPLSGVKYSMYEDAKDYNLEILGVNEFVDEVNLVVKGTKKDLETYADEVLGYQLHPDYLYDEDDFAGDIITNPMLSFKYWGSMVEENKHMISHIEVDADYSYGEDPNEIVRNVAFLNPGYVSPDSNSHYFSFTSPEEFETQLAKVHVDEHFYDDDVDWDDPLEDYDKDDYEESLNESVTSIKLKVGDTFTTNKEEIIDKIPENWLMGNVKFTIDEIYKDGTARVSYVDLNNPSWKGNLDDETDFTIAELNKLVNIPNLISEYNGKKLTDEVVNEGILDIFKKKDTKKKEPLYGLYNRIYGYLAYGPFESDVEAEIELDIMAQRSDRYANDLVIRELTDEDYKKYVKESLTEEDLRFQSQKHFEEYLKSKTIILTDDVFYDDTSNLESEEEYEEFKKAGFIRDEEEVWLPKGLQIKFDHSANPGGAGFYYFTTTGLKNNISIAWNSLYIRDLLIDTDIWNENTAASFPESVECNKSLNEKVLNLSEVVKDAYTHWVDIHGDELPTASDIADDILGKYEGYDDFDTFDPTRYRNWVADVAGELFRQNLECSDGRLDESINVGDTYTFSKPSADWNIKNLTIVEAFKDETNKKYFKCKQKTFDGKNINCKVTEAYLVNAIEDLKPTKQNSRAEIKK